MSITNAATVLKGVDPDLVDKVLGIVKASSVISAVTSETKTHGTFEHDGQNLTPSLNVSVDKRGAPLRSILKSSTKSIKGQTEELKNESKSSGSEKKSLDGWLPAPSKNASDSGVDRDSKVTGDRIETIERKQALTGGDMPSRKKRGREGYTPRFKQGSAGPTDPGIGSYRTRLQPPQSWHPSGEENYRLPYPPPFPPVPGGMVYRPRLMPPPTDLGFVTRCHFVVPSQPDAYRQVFHHLNEDVGPHGTYQRDVPLVPPSSYDSLPRGGGGGGAVGDERILRQGYPAYHSGTPSSVNSWPAGRLDSYVSSSSGSHIVRNEDMYSKNAMVSDSSTLFPRKIEDNRYLQTNLEDRFHESGRISLHAGDDFKRTSGRFFPADSSAVPSEQFSRRIGEDVSSDNKALDESQLALKRKIVEQIASLILPRGQGLQVDGKDFWKSQIAENSAYARDERSNLAFSKSCIVSGGDDLDRKVYNSEIGDLDDEELLRNKLLCEIERRKHDLENILDRYTPQNVGTDKFVDDFEKALRTDSTAGKMIPSPFGSLGSQEKDISSKEADNKSQMSFLGPDFISVCKSLASVIEKRNKLELTKRQSELAQHTLPNTRENFSEKTGKKPEFFPGKDLRQSVSEHRLKSSVDISSHSSRKGNARSEIPHSQSRGLVKSPNKQTTRSDRYPGPHATGNRKVEPKAAKFIGFLKEEREAFWENLKTQLGERYTKQMPLENMIGGDSDIKKDDANRSQSLASRSDYQAVTKPANSEKERNEIEAEVTSELENQRQISEKKVKDISGAIGGTEVASAIPVTKSALRRKRRINAARVDTKLTIVPTMNAEQSNEAKDVSETRMQMPLTSKDKRSREDVDWRCIPQTTVEGGLQSTEPGNQKKLLSSSAGQLKATGNVPRKVVLRKQLLGQRGASRGGIQQKAGQKRLRDLALGDQDSRIPSLKKTVVVNKSTNDGKVPQRIAVHLMGKHRLVISEDCKRPNSDQCSDIGKQQSSENIVVTCSSDNRSKDNSSKKSDICDIKEIQQRSQEDYDERNMVGNLRKGASKIDHSRPGLNSRFESNIERPDKKDVVKQPSTSRGQGRYPEHSDFPSGSHGDWKGPHRRRDYRDDHSDVDMRNYSQEQNLEDFPGRGFTERYSDEPEQMDCDENYGDDFSYDDNEYPPGKFDDLNGRNRSVQSRPRGGKDRFSYNKNKEFYQSERDCDDRKGPKFHSFGHQKGWNRQFVHRSNRGFRPRYKNRFSNDRRNDNQKWFEEDRYEEEPESGFDDAYGSGEHWDNSATRRDYSKGSFDNNRENYNDMESWSYNDCDDRRSEYVDEREPSAMSFSGRRQYPDNSEMYPTTSRARLLDEEPVDDDMYPETGPSWNDHNPDDFEATDGGHRWEDFAFETHQMPEGRAFQRKNAFHAKSRFQKNKFWNNTRRPHFRRGGFTFRQNSTRGRRRQFLPNDPTAFETDGSVAMNSWNSEEALPKVSHSLQDIIKDVMANVKEAKTVDPATDTALFESLSRGEKRQVLEVQQMTGIKSITVIVSALKMLWDLEPKVVRTLGSLEPDVIQQIGDER